MEEENAFAEPPADAPIVLEAPAEDTTPEFAAPAPADDGFVGTVDETPADDDAAPIILGGEPSPLEDQPDAAADDFAEPEIPEEIAPTGPTPMQIWNEEWQQVLLQRKDEENAKKAEFLEAAKQAMETFSSQRETKREAKMTTNRSDEQAKLEAIEADLENDNSWQKVCKLVELSHDSDAADVKRMRDTMILLKNDTEKAAILA